ncbi:hypothetical protein [Roseofilum casamattae]|uniref:Uncharacterized protein n=1 Tax=Roseofilum casamattae BLCC-M143 TaxID=3022442 RepID=A0ABT7BZA3_9CYAN|nr:hypothetical protein [Roseofilum casamattae]MDJ1184532.1 hypothetical protein [Roseofilum casamattae BLCC-M143]
MSQVIVLDSAPVSSSSILLANNAIALNRPIFVNVTHKNCS